MGLHVVYQPAGSIVHPSPTSKYKNVTRSRIYIYIYFLHGCVVTPLPFSNYLLEENMTFVLDICIREQKACYVVINTKNEIKTKLALLDNNN